MPLDELESRRWLAQWQAAAPALRAQRARDLRQLTPARARAASDALLELGASLPLPPQRRTYSGLVEMQRLLLLARRA